MRFVYVLNKRYKVFEDGTIVSCCRKKEKVLKPQLKSNGYLEVANVLSVVPTDSIA